MSFLKIYRTLRHGVGSLKKTLYFLSAAFFVFILVGSFWEKRTYYFVSTTNAKTVVVKKCDSYAYTVLSVDVVPGVRMNFEPLLESGIFILTINLAPKTTFQFDSLNFTASKNVSVKLSAHKYFYREAPQSDWLVSAGGRLENNDNVTVAYRLDIDTTEKGLVGYEIFMPDAHINGAETKLPTISIKVQKKYFRRKLLECWRV